MLSRTKMLCSIVRPCQRYLSAQDIYQEDTRQFIDMLKNSKEADIFKGCNVSGRVLGVEQESGFKILQVDWGHKLPANVVVEKGVDVKKGEWILGKLLTPELAICEGGKKKWTSLRLSSLEFVCKLPGPGPDNSETTWSPDSVNS